MRVWQLAFVAVLAAFTVEGLDLPVEAPVYDPRPPRANGLPPHMPPPEPEKLDAPWPHDPPTFYGEEIGGGGESLVYVVDYSGSMIVDYRITRAKKELAASLEGLSEGFEFGVVIYNCYLKAWQRELMQATPGNKQAALAWLDAQTTGGGTGTGPATVLGLSMDPDAVVLLTDGQPNCTLDTQAHRAMIRRANLRRVPIDVFGIQCGGWAREFCQQVAAESGGHYTDVR